MSDDTKKIPELEECRTVSPVDILHPVRNKLAPGAALKRNLSPVSWESGFRRRDRTLFLWISSRTGRV